MLAQHILAFAAEAAAPAAAARKPTWPAGAAAADATATGGKRTAADGDAAEAGHRKRPKVDAAGDDLPPTPAGSGGWRWRACAPLLAQAIRRQRKLFYRRVLDAHCPVPTTPAASDLQRFTPTPQVGGLDIGRVEAVTPLKPSKLAIRTRAAAPTGVQVCAGGASPHLAGGPLGTAEQLARVLERSAA